MSTSRGRYSRVSRRIWNSASFRALSQPKPCGAWLFFRLLTAPELTAIPGLFQAWEAGLAQALGWSLKDFRAAWLEVEHQGLAKADWSRGLVWLPKGITHNEPESPKVVLGWRVFLSELPECDLLDEAIASLGSWAKAKGEPWAKAFAKAIGKAIAEPMAIKMQEQEQEQKQEQEQEKPTSAKAFAMHAGWKPRPETLAAFEVGLIPTWGIGPLVSRFRAHFCAVPNEERTAEAWEQSCSKWVFGDWQNPKKRPKKPEDFEDSERVVWQE